MQAKLVYARMKGWRHQLGRDQSLAPLVRTLFWGKERKVPGHKGEPSGPADHFAVPANLLRNGHDCAVDRHQLPPDVAPGAGPNIRTAPGLGCHLERRRRTVQAVGQGIPPFRVGRDQVIVVTPQAVLECPRADDIRFVVIRGKSGQHTTMQQSKFRAFTSKRQLVSDGAFCWRRFCCGLLGFTHPLHPPP